MSVVAYVSGHGFGHSARQIEILRHLPERIPLVVKTRAPEWFWRDELPRPFEYVADAFDVGCVQHDSLSIDVSATLAAYQAVRAQNEIRRASEIADLRARNSRVVVTDVAAFPLPLARALGIPGVCVANFTWADIYAEYQTVEPAFVPLVREMETQYMEASLLLDAAMSLPMPYFPARESVGLVARAGMSERERLLAVLPPFSRERERAQAKRLVLMYLGNWGFPLPYDRLADLTDWHFVSLDDAPVPLPNWTRVPRDLMPHPSLVASVDVVVSKAGYGLCGECLAHGTPLLYPARPGFAEFAALDAALSNWPGGIFVSDADWNQARFAPYLDRVPPRGATPALSTPGGKNAAQKIADLWYSSC